MLQLPLESLLCVPREAARAASASCLHRGMLEPWGPRAGRQGWPSDTHAGGRLLPVLLSARPGCREPWPTPRLGGSAEAEGRGTVPPSPGLLTAVLAVVSAAGVLSGGSGGSQLTPFIARGGGSGRPPRRPLPHPSLCCLPYGSVKASNTKVLVFLFFSNSHQRRGIVPSGLCNFIWAEWF